MSLTSPLDHRVKGVDHAAFPTFHPAETVRFYRDVLGFPVAHAICAKGWGPAGHPDFIHFFFDIGRDDRLAFFYYFGLEPATPRGAGETNSQGDDYAVFGDDAPLWFVRSRHLAIHVDDEADLHEYKRRLDASQWPCEMLVTHETIESIYVHDPNGYFLEFTRATRPLVADEVVDANHTIDALLATLAQPVPSMSRLWEQKGAAIDGSSEETTLFVLDVPEFSPLAAVAARDSEVSVRKVGPYFEIRKRGDIVIDRRATGCRHACWYSAVAGVRNGRIAQFDKDALRVVPT